MSPTPHDLPVDETSRARLAAGGLRMSLVSTSDQPAFDAWFRAETRGFLGSTPSAERIDAARGAQGHRRTTGIYDDTVPTAQDAAPEPVATAQCWPSELTLPGLATVPAWAISGISVAATHRRRGIATSMLEAELRTAVALGMPLAILTVSESTIYHRFGFGPATVLTHWSVDTHRGGWRGRTPAPAAAGRLSYADPAGFRETGIALLDRIRRSRAGEIGKDEVLATRLIGPLPGSDSPEKYRLVRYDDAEGVCQGFLSYALKENDDDYALHTLEIAHLAAATDDADLALRRFAMEHDLVGTITTYTGADDEPWPAVVVDWRRAAQIGREDHLWTRVLDVPRVLEARTYEHDATLVLAIDDPLGFAQGTYRVRVVEGRATVERTDDAADATLAITALGSLHLGGIPARHLALRGEISGDVDAVDALFRTRRPPFLGSWF